MFGVIIVRFCALYVVFFFQAEDGIRDYKVTGVQTCALPISPPVPAPGARAAAARQPPGTARSRHPHASRHGGCPGGPLRILAGASPPPAPCRAGRAWA